MGYKWENMRPLIEQLYLQENMTLEDVMARLRDKYDFKPCTRAYRDHLKKWGMVKYKKRGDGVYSSADSATDHPARLSDDTQAWSAPFEPWPYRGPESMYAVAYETAPQLRSQPGSDYCHVEIQPCDSAASRMELVNVMNQPREDLPSLHGYGHGCGGAGRLYAAPTYPGYCLYASERST